MSCAPNRCPANTSAAARTGVGAVCYRAVHRSGGGTAHAGQAARPVERLRHRGQRVTAPAVDHAVGEHARQHQLGDVVQRGHVLLLHPQEVVAQTLP